MSRKRDDYFSLPCNKNDDTDIKSFNNSYFSNIKKDLKLREYAKGRSKCSPNDFSSSLSKKLNNSRNQLSQFSNVVLNNAIKKDDSSINNIALLTCNTKFTTTTLTEKVFYETSNLHRQDENINKKRSTFRLKFKGFQRTKQSPLKNSHELPLRKEIDHENDTNKSINIRFNLFFFFLLNFIFFFFFLLNFNFFYLFFLLFLLSKPKDSSKETLFLLGFFLFNFFFISTFICHLQILFTSKFYVFSLLFIWNCSCI